MSSAASRRGARASGSHEEMLEAAADADKVSG
jgi:hypothetical protein